MKTPMISIVMPVYNSEEYISESIESILKQTFTDFELIIVDDGSTDKTLDIIESFCDERIKLIKNKHDYIQSLNKGIAEAKGKYIARMDSDDIMLPHRLEIQYRYMENNLEIDVCGGWMESFGHTSSSIIRSPITHKELQSYMLMGNCMSHPTTILRSESLKKLSSYPKIYQKKYIYAEDYKLWIDLLISGLTFANIPDIILKYRISGNQNTSKYSPKMSEATYKTQLEYLEFVMEDIIKRNDIFYDFINSSIELCNNEQLNYRQLRQIIYTIYQEILIVN